MMAWGNRKSCNILFLIIALIFTILVPVGTVSAAESRTEQLFSGTNQTAGRPDISGSYIVFSQKQGTFYYPCYMNMDSGEKGIINEEVSLLNNDPVKISGGVALYRSKNKDKLWITNLDGQQHWGLGKGESRVVAADEFTEYFAISGDTIAYLKDGLSKTCKLITEGGEQQTAASHIKAKDLRIYNEEGNRYLIWLNTDDMQLNYCSLDQDFEVRSLAGSKTEAPYFSVWDHQVAYRNPDDQKLYIQTLETAAEPAELPLTGASGPVALQENKLFYAAGATIKSYDFEIGSTSVLYTHPGSIMSLAAQDFDMVWKDSGNLPYWRAGARTLALSGQQTIKVGEELQVTATVYFKNNFQADMSDAVEWSSTNEEIATISQGRCTGMSSGSVEIRAVYEGVYAVTSFTVKALQSLEINPAAASLEPGDTLQLQAAGWYTDGSWEDLSSSVNWQCSSGSITPQGLFTAGEPETVHIQAAIDTLDTAAEINVQSPGGTDDYTPPEEQDPPAEEAQPPDDDPAPDEQDNGQDPLLPAEPEPGADEDGSLPDTPEDESNPDPTAPSDSPAGNESENHPRHSDDDYYTESVQIESPSSVILNMLKEAPASTMVTIEFESLKTQVEFVLDQACLEIMKAENKTLRIKTGFGYLEFSPAFASGVSGQSLTFTISAGAEEEMPDRYGSCSLNPAGGICSLNAKNQKEQTISSFPASVAVNLQTDKAGELDSEKLGILMRKPPDTEWTFLKSRSAGGESRIFDLWSTGSFTLAEISRGYSDLEEHWAQRDIEILSARQLLANDDEDDFEPERNITRAEFTGLLVRAMNLPFENASAQLNDVPFDSPEYPGIAAAAEAGLVQGSGAGLFAPDRELSREEMGVMIVRALEKSNFAFEVSSQPPILITDREKISPWAREELETLVQLGIIKGMPDGSLAPQKPGTRAQAASLVKRLLDVWENDA